MATKTEAVDADMLVEETMANATVEETLSPSELDHRKKLSFFPPPKEELRTSSVGAHAVGGEAAMSPSPCTNEPLEDFEVTKVLEKGGRNTNASSPEVDVDDFVAGIPPIPPRQAPVLQPGAYPRAGFDANRRQSDGTILIGLGSEELMRLEEDQNDTVSPDVVEHLPDTSGLVEARRVSDVPQADLENAQPVQERDALQDREVTHKRQALVTMGWMLACFVLLVVVVAVSTALSSNKDTTNTKAPTTPPALPTMAPTPFLLDLPEYTQQAILQDPTSPQAQAYQWIRDDPMLNNFTDWRVIQRFALSTFFYATNGPNWKTVGGRNQTFNVSATNIKPARPPPEAANGPGGPPPPPPSQGIGPASEYTIVTTEEWLSYNTKECEWYSNAVLRGVPRCNETGFYRSITFHGNNLVGTIPPQVALLSPTLYGFNLRKNPLLQGTVPSQLAQLSVVSLLDLGDNGLTGSLPTQLGLLTGRTHVFRFDHNRISGSIPTEFLHLWNLRELVLNDNQMTGTIPSKIGTGMPSLIRLDLQNNPRMTGTIPTSLGQLSIKKSLRLDGNPYTGSLPSELGNLTSMGAFLVNNTQISSTLPSELGRLNRIKTLDLSNTMISGTIPTEWSGMYPTLEHLDLHSTAISGRIPEEWSLLNATVLKHLNIAGTSITGTIPESLCGVKTLRFYCEPSLCGCTCPCDTT